MIITRSGSSAAYNTAAINQTYAIVLIASDMIVLMLAIACDMTNLDGRTTGDSVIGHTDSLTRATRNAK